MNCPRIFQKPWEWSENEHLSNAPPRAFDRMIIAQARLEGLTIATHDAIFKKYGVSVLDV